MKFVAVRRLFRERVTADFAGRETERILDARRQTGLEGTTVDVGDVPEEGSRRGEERGRGGGGRRRRWRRWRRMTLSLSLGVIRWTVRVYAAVMETHASHQQLLLHRRLMAKLFQPQLVLSLPLGSRSKHFAFTDPPRNRQLLRDIGRKSNGTLARSQNCNQVIPPMVSLMLH